MKCNICDAQLSEKSISFNPDINTFEPCLTCLEIAFDAAYCDGFQKIDEEGQTNTIDIGEEDLTPDEGSDKFMFTLKDEEQEE